MLEGLWVAFYSLFLPVTLCISILNAAIIFCVRTTTGKSQKGTAAFLAAFGALGGIAGLIAGASKEPLIGGFLTSLLGLVSAILGYLFSKESLATWRPYIPYAIILLVVSSLAGLSIGSVYKRRFEDHDLALKRAMLEYEKVYLPVMKEERLMQLKAQYATPATFAASASPSASATAVGAH